MSDIVKEPYLVILRLKNNIQVAGLRIETRERDVVLLDDAMEIRYRNDHSSGRPVIYLTKYMPFEKGMKVKFRVMDILNIFIEPIDEFASYYKQHVHKLKNKDVEWNVEEMKTNRASSPTDVGEVINELERILTSNTSVH